MDANLMHSNQKQKLLLEYLISSVDVFALCNGIILPDYFDPTLRNSVAFIQEYYELYHTIPTTDQISAETATILETREIRLDQIDYTATEVENFCKQRAIEKAVLGASKLIDVGDYGAIENNIREAIMVSLHRDLGLRYFEDPLERLNRMLVSNPVHSTGWSDVDAALFGGISRKELLLISASSGGGKSITLTNLGANFLRSGMNVLYVSLELSEDIIAQRFDTIFTGVGRQTWKSRISEITTRLSSIEQNHGVLDIIQLTSGSNSNHIRAYLKEYYLQYNMMPDLIIIDYLDKMNPNEKINASDVWTKDKLVSEQIRDIGVHYNMFVASASQLGRSAVGAVEHDHSQIAGGISKINESDVYWSIIMTDAMKAAGEMQFMLQKTRNSDGAGKIINMKWDPVTLRITDVNSLDGGWPMPISNKTNKPMSLSDIIIT